MLNRGVGHKDSACSSSSSADRPQHATPACRAGRRQHMHAAGGRTVACAAAAAEGRHAAMGPTGSGGSGGGRTQQVAVLGGEDFIYSQMSGVSEDLFKGDRLGVFADVASTDFRQSELRSLAHLPDEFAPPPRFLDRVTLHLAKNWLASMGQLGAIGQVPLILGIWGPKGAGKSFNLELCLKALGVLPIIVSAGELEDEVAGEPGKRLRERYRFAARYAASSGVPTCLIINDLDAGVGTWINTDTTVNTQIVQATLMAICDDPTLVSTGQAWAAAGRPCTRVPIFITANDLRYIYAPLVREGRMEKWFFQPSRAELADLLTTLFDDGFGPGDARALVDAFPGQSLDFFAAVRSRLADKAVQEWLAATPTERREAALLGDELVHANDAGAWRSHARVRLAPVPSLAAALRAGEALAEEQQAVLDINLVREYFKHLDPDPEALQQQQQQQQAHQPDRARQESQPHPQQVQRVVSEEMAAYWAYMSEQTVVKHEDSAEETAAEEERQRQQEAERLRREEAERAAAAAARGWATLEPDQVAEALRKRAVSVVDIRSAREREWGTIKASVHVAAVLTTGGGLNPVSKPNPDFASQVAAKFPDRASALVVLGASRQPGAVGSNGSATPAKGVFVSKAPTASGDEDVVARAIRALQAEGYTNVCELEGGFTAWDLAYRPDGRRREKGKWADKSSGELEYWTASN